LLKNGWNANYFFSLHTRASDHMAWSLMEHE